MPAGVTTLLAIRTTVRQRCDMVNSQFITDAEFNGYINASYYELYDLLVQKYGDNYFVASPFAITTDGVATQYALPADFYKLLGVDLKLTASPASFVTLQPFNFKERNRFGAPNVQTVYGTTNLRYRLNGNSLWLQPLPSGGQSLQVWYVPRLVALVADADTVDGVSGWEEYIVADVCIKAMVKEESDPSGFAAQKAALAQRIEAAAENRDAGSPATVVDSRGANRGAFDGGEDGYC